MKPPRLTVRQFTPQKMPYQITPEDFTKALTVIYPKLEKVVYAGWGRRVNAEGKRGVGFFISTGTSSLEARKRFKTSQEFGTKIWQITA